VLPLVREREKFEPAARRWAAAHPAAFPHPGALTKVVVARSGDTRVAEAFLNVEQRPPVRLLWVETPAGWQLDWRAFSGEGDLSFTEFAVQRPSRPVLLLTAATLSDYYNGPFADAAAWQCLRLTSAAPGSDIIYAYADRRNAALMEKLSALKQPSSRRPADVLRVAIPLALQVHVPENTPDGELPQAVVDSVEGEGWYVP
jgi:hypothetical protein